LGINWEPSRKCQHPDHVLTGKTNKQPTTRTATFQQLDYLKEKLGAPKPIGIKLCMFHVKRINKAISDLADELNDSNVSAGYSEEFHPDQLSHEELEDSVETQHALSTVLELSPSWTIKRKSVEDLSENTIRCLKSKYKKAKTALKDHSLLSRLHQNNTCS